MLKVGLTGSIAVGKSFVCGVFRELGCHVLDADLTAREVVEPNTRGLSRIIENFGTAVLRPTGELDRAKLGELVFADRGKLDLLNSIVHPLVFEAQDAWLRDREREDPDGIAIVDAALMIESGGYKRFEKLIVVWCEAGVQLARLMARNGLSESEAERRIASQMPQEEKKKFADLLIDTSKGYEDARRQATEVYQRLRHLSETGPR
jgi:dephospho-CoA kinase